VTSQSIAPGALMAAEVAEQPAVLAQILAASDEFTAAAERIAAAKSRFVLIAARGTSDHAGLYAKYLAEVLLQLPAGLVSPSSLTIYGARPEMHDVLFITVSQSGRSPDLVDSLSAARSRGALTVAVTNAIDSPLAAAAEIAVDVRAGTERAVAATKSYTAQLLSLYLLIAGVRAAGAAARLPEAAARTLALTPDDRLAAVAAPLQYAERLVVTARGYAYATAREAALKLMETSYLSAMAFSGADLLHGPLAMIDRSVPVIAVTSPGRGGDAMAPVLERLHELGAHVLQVGPPDGLPIASEGIPEELLPVLEILPLQRLAWRLALDRGVDPDRPRGLSKVTQTL
jgi:glucosamine--fructose-6-phosphate aminotransferase (isomerizing)